ncbi:MAG: hypothetical protein ACMVP2_27565 [Imperialibacter sp.]|uniref:hypothetical protein n=1 Tax=Imperialibacter sp. TaxID=2038411 RepID=UPI003A8B70A9
MKHIYLQITGGTVFLILTIAAAALVGQPLTETGNALYKQRQPDPVRGHYKSIS